MRRFPILTLALLAGIAGLGATAPAANEALYDAPPPPDAVFVRWLDGDGTPAALGPVLAPVAGAESEFGHVSASETRGIAPGAHLSVVRATDGTPVLIQEPARDAVGQVHLILVNAADGPVDLVVAEAGAVVLADVAPFTSEVRAVNPVSADLVVQDTRSGNALGHAALHLQRGQDVTLFVSPAGLRVIPDGFGAGPLLP
ncbi:MAG: hypothetical protein AAGG09_02640 [Pseudomonadota bacterium]